MNTREKINDELIALHKYWAREDENSDEKWLLHRIRNSFEAVATYELKPEEEQMLLDDMLATHAVLRAAKNYSKQFDANKLEPKTEEALYKAIDDVRKRADEPRAPMQDALKVIAGALYLLAAGLLIGAVICASMSIGAPILITSLAITSLVLNLSAGATLLTHGYRESYTFFGKNRKGQRLMNDLIDDISSALEPDDTGCRC